MTVYPKLEKLITGLAYCCLTEPDMLAVCEAAGIDWAWPRTFAGDVMREYLEAGDREKMRASIRMLETQVENLAAIPNDIDELRITYRDLCRTQAAVDLANSILKSPEAHERILSGFDSFSPQAVETTDYAGLVASYELVKKEMAIKGPMTVIPAFPNVSRLIGGFDPQRITLLLAKSGGGKSILGMSLAFAATDIMAVGYMNLEMGFDDTSKRIAVALSGKTWREHYRNEIEVDDLPKPENLKHELRMSSGKELSLRAIMGWARAYKKTNPDFGLLVIDYDQKLQLETDHRTPEWKAFHMAIRELEELAKQIKIHVILSAQFNREGQIASSHRMINTAHTVLTFREHDGGQIVENSIKCRWAKYPCALFVNYDRSGARVTEIAGNTIFDLVDESQSREKIAADGKNKFQTMMGKL